MDNDNIYAASREEAWREELRKSMSPKERTAIARVKMPELDPAYRITCSEEVNQGITAEMALLEAKRCLDCPNPQCVTGCPVGINIPKFTSKKPLPLSRRRVRCLLCAAAYALKRSNAKASAFTSR